MKRIMQRAGLLVAAIVATGALLTGAPARAIDVFSNACNGGSGQGTGNNGGTTSSGGASGASNGTSSICGASEKDDFNTIAKNIINTLLYVVGIVAVVMIIIGGIRYAASNGDSSSIQGAKNTILYAVIGLIVAIMAFAIVNFVVGRFGGSSGGGGSSNNSGTPATPRDTGTVTEN